MRAKLVKFLLALSIFTGFSFFVDAPKVQANEISNEIPNELVNYNELSEEPVDAVDINIEGYEEYIISDGEVFRFDLRSAQMNNESYEMLEFGKIFNSLAADSGQYLESPGMITTMGIVEATKYGNWCGSGNNGKPAIDALDYACMQHDKCYVRNGQWDRDCNRTFVNAIRRLKANGFTNRISAYGRIYAAAAEALFSTWM